MNGYGVFFVPFSWAIGRWDRKKEGSLMKTLWAFGPFRFFICRGLGPWKDDSK